MSDVLADSRARLTAPLTVSTRSIYLRVLVQYVFQFRPVEGIRFLEDGRLSLSFSPDLFGEAENRCQHAGQCKENLPHSCLAASPDIESVSSA